MTSPDQWFTCVGLGLDIIGVILLYRYGLPSRYPEKGMSIRWPSGEDEASKKRERQRFRRLSDMGLALLVIGFVLQIVGTLWLGPTA